MDNLHLIQLAQYERPSITEERNRDWVAIGDDNNYYQCLIDAYMDSTTNKAVINGIVNQIYGKGLDATDSNKKPEQYAQMKSLLKANDLRNICQDLKMLGEASLQISYTGKKISSITHFPRETLRAEKMNDEGKVKNYYYSSDWTKVQKNTELKKIPVFGSGAKNEIYIIKKYVTGFYYYSPADYNYAYATLENEIANFLINDAKCSFSGTKIINFNNGTPDREKQVAIKNDVMNKLTGSYGERVIVAFNNNAESKTTIDDVSLSDAPQHYEYLSSECSRKIMLTHRVTSPLLIGMRDGNNGLGNNQDEIVTAQRLFTNTTIKPYQELITDALDEILAVNNISLNLYFKTIEPLEFMNLDELEDEEKEEATGIKEQKESTELELLASKYKNNDLADEDMDIIFEGLEGEIMDEEWEIADVREYDEENTDIEEWAGNVIEMNLAQAVKRKTPIENNPNRFSVLDKSFYKVRYRYAEVKQSDNSRKFCREMMKRSDIGVVYRIEDIDTATKNWSSKKFKSLELPMHNNKPFSLFRHKGGVYCGHKWEEVLYKVKNKKNKGSDKIKDYDVVESIPKSQKPNPRGHQDAKVAPINTPSRGHHPSYVAPKKRKK